MKAVRARHLSRRGDWRTPPQVVDSARRVLGGIDLDPASDQDANKAVRASKIFTAEDDGLGQEWSGSAMLNPPGSCGLDICGNAHVCSCDLVRRFWSHLVNEFMRRSVEAFIWIGFSVEQLSRLQSVAKSPLDFQVCIPRKRLHYWHPEIAAKSPTHSSYIAYGGKRAIDFHNEFSQYGKVIG